MIASARQLCIQDRMWQWITGPSTVSSTGDVVSWVNPDHPGYSYPEAAALLLRLLAVQSPERVTLRNSIADCLMQRVSTRGGVGRNGAEYAFDTSMALAALLAHKRHGGSGVHDTLPAHLLDFIGGCIRMRHATGDPEERSLMDHWSVRYGCHLLKLIIALREHDEESGQYQCRPLIEQLVADNLTLFCNGRFRTHECSAMTYLHAHCYALEGLLSLPEGSPEIDSVLMAGAAWLARVQTDAGGIRAWHDGARASGPERAEATAQAVRIWCCVDPRRFGAQINHGLQFLSTLEAPGGGLYYEAGSEDVNTWATIFGIQAWDWAQHGARPADLV